MYLKRISIRNIRCISELDIDLESRASSNNSLVLLGDNGVGKSTILKCIALGMCDEGGASALLADMYGALIRSGEDCGEIKLVLNRGKSEYSITTQITKSPDDEDIEEIRRETTSSEETFPWSQVFLCGYGPSRVLRGTKSYEQYAIADAVYTLFMYDWELQNPELTVRRYAWKNPKREKEILAQLAEILMVKRNAIKLSRTGITMQEDFIDIDVPFGALADGHQSTLNWVLDLIAWTYLNERKSPAGVVLIDEIENHLHPKWQRHIMRLISDAFPRIQFIATSHSAICAASVTDKTQRGFVVGESHVLRRSNDGSVVNTELSELAGMRYDQVLSSLAFDFTPRFPTQLEQLLNRVRQTYVDPKSKQTAAFKKAIEELRALSPFDAEKEVDRINQAEFETIVATAKKRTPRKASKKKR